MRIVVIRRPLRRVYPVCGVGSLVFVSAQVDRPAAVLHTARRALAAEIEAAVYFVTVVGIGSVYGAAPSAE